MTMNPNRSALALAASVALLLVAACGGGAPTPAAKPAGAGTTVEFLPSVWSEAPLANPVDVLDLRAKGKDGDKVIVRGTLKDFGELATFQLVEDSLKDCTEEEDSACKEPWDYCCTDPTELARLTVNVEFLDGDLPAEGSLRGWHGLDHLTEVVVAGTLRIDEAGNLRLEATRLTK